MTQKQIVIGKLCIIIELPHRIALFMFQVARPIHINGEPAGVAEQYQVIDLNTYQRPFIGTGLA